MKDKERTEEISDEELVQLFNQATSNQEKLQYFSQIQDDNCKIELLKNIPENEKYKYIGKLRNSKNIAEQLTQIEDEKSKIKSFNFIVKQLKGNSKGLLELLEAIDFKVTLPENMLLLQINNLNDINMDMLIKIQQNVTNFSDLKFKINEENSENVEYSFSEMSAITAKIEELIAGIPEDSSEIDRFYTIYFRIINNITYNYDTVNQTNNAILEDKARRKNLDANNSNYFAEYKKIKQETDRKIDKIRKDSAGMYGGLVEGKAICVGYATILQESLKKVGIKSLIVSR